MTGSPLSVVPRPHPLMRRTSLVNQFKFLGLVHTFATFSLSSVCAKPAKKSTDTRIEITIIEEVLCINYRSCNLIGPYHF